jgi:hypothetical protein
MLRDDFEMIVDRLLIVDRDSRVGEVALRSLEPSSKEHSFVQFDLNGRDAWKSHPANLVVAYASIERTNDPRLAMQHVKGLMVKGGLLSTSMSIQDRDFEILDSSNGLYRWIG